MKVINFSQSHHFQNNRMTILLSQTSNYNHSNNKLHVYIFFQFFFLNRSSNKYEQNDYYKFST